MLIKFNGYQKKVITQRAKSFNLIESKKESNSKDYGSLEALSKIIVGLAGEAAFCIAYDIAMERKYSFETYPAFEMWKLHRIFHENRSSTKTYTYSDSGFEIPICKASIKTTGWGKIADTDDYRASAESKYDYHIFCVVHSKARVLQSAHDVEEVEIRCWLSQNEYVATQSKKDPRFKDCVMIPGKYWHGIASFNFENNCKGW